MFGAIAQQRVENKMGYIHVYTGDGKGKTTAAFGLALRHLYAGGTVFIGQFVKSERYAECGIAGDRADIAIEQFGRDCFINKAPAPVDVDLARAGLARMAEILKCGRYSLVIFDEVTIALYYKLFSVAELIDVLATRADCVEIVLTGRYAPAELIDYADLVSDIREVKHYYQQGVLSRRGIDK